MSVRYQSEQLLARSELLDEPLVEAINDNDASLLKELIALWGFSQAWQRVLSRVQIRDWLVTAMQLPDESYKTIEEEIKISIQFMNANYAINSREEFDEDFIKCLIKIMQSGYINEEDFIKRQIKFVASELDSIQSSNQINSDSISDLLQEANLYSEIKGGSLFDDMEYHFSGDFYAKYLSGKNEDYVALKIEDIILVKDGQKEMVEYASETSGCDLFDGGILKYIKVANPAVADCVKEENSDLINEVVSSFIADEAIENVADFRKIILSQEWNVPGFGVYYDQSTSLRDKFGAEFAAQAIAHKVLFGNSSDLEGYEEFIGDEEFNQLLTSYLRYARSVHIILSKLNTPLLPYISASVGEIINKHLIESMATSKFATDDYLLVRDRVEGSKPLELIRLREPFLVSSLTEDIFLKLDIGFLQDVFNDNDLIKLKGKMLDICLGVFNNVDKFTSYFNELHVNQKFVLDEMVKAGNFIHMEINIGIFADWYRNAPESELSSVGNVNFLWSCLEANQRQEILDQLHDVLLERQTRLGNRISMLHSFHNDLLFKEPGSGIDRRGIAALFNASLDDGVLSNWLDNQQFSFSRWSLDDSRAATVCILENQTHFPQLCRSSQYIKNRIEQLNAEKGKGTE